MVFRGAYSLFDLGPYTVYVLGAIIIWELVWKGFALWKSARLRHPVWFIAILIFNTIGVLSILYIFIFSEMKIFKVSKKGKRKRKK